MNNGKPESPREQQTRLRNELHRLLQNANPQFIHVIKNWLAQGTADPHPAFKTDPAKQRK